MKLDRIKTILFPERRYDSPQEHNAGVEMDPYQELTRAMLPDPRDWSMR